MRRLPLLLAVSLLVVLAPRARALDEAANAPVVTLETALVAMLRSGEDAGFLDRYRALYKSVAATHDLEAMTRARVGPGWAILDGDARGRLRNLLFKRLVTDYVVKLDGVGTLTRAPAEETTDGGGIARLTSKDRLLVALRVEEGEDGWHITDVRWGGRDTVAAEQEESRTLLSSGGATALEEAWAKKVEIPSGDAARAPARSPKEVVAYLQDSILDIMREADALGFRGRYERFAPLIDETHHLPAIAQLTIRRPWASLSKEQRVRFVEKFREFSIARYASRFDGYSGERFEFRDEQDQGSAKVIRSDLVKSDGEKVRFDWILREVDGRWRILNIIVDGVSDLATKQAEYNDIFQKRGFPGLMQKVEEQIRLQETRGE